MEFGVLAMSDQLLSGVFAPALTPFKKDLSIDKAEHLRFCKWLLANNVGLAVFGTNSEANSLSVGERMELLDNLVSAGIPGSRLVPGNGTCTLPDTIMLTRAALEAGAAAVLMLPPFFYKNVSEEGVFASYAEVIERVGDSRLRILLYHIPQLSGVPVTLTLLERLLVRYPGVIAGVKDSSGDMANTTGVLRAFPQLRVFCGSESFLLETMRGGGAGCISGCANVNPTAIDRLYREWRSLGADGLQAALSKVRSVIEARPMIAALKATVAEFGGNPSFATVRPPLVKLDDGQKAELLAALAGLQFGMPGLSGR
jgi:4-hydroxy-tetrahydrodipicolinate synthase